MPAIDFSSLPAPPAGKQGWPWVLAPSSFPDADERWPLITVVTPSFNQGAYLEETIRSVLFQGYPNLEYFVIDGGSTDDSIEVMRKYSPWLTHWISEKDRGQTDAICKGLKLATGEVWNWLNSDDMLEKDALFEVARLYNDHPEAMIYAGRLVMFGGGGEPYFHPDAFTSLEQLCCVWDSFPTPQPAMFLNRRATEQVGGLRADIHYAMDYELYLRLAERNDHCTALTAKPLARFRLHPESKTCSQQLPFRQEILHVFDDFARRHPERLPRNWRFSRLRSGYHQERDGSADRDTLRRKLLLFAKFSRVLWNYRFFWADLFKLRR